jgi:iodotyrosine deiodinase
MESKYIPYDYTPVTTENSLERSRNFYEHIDKRRSVRQFSTRPVPEEVINNIIMTASSAPSGAHKQPWTFCAVSNPDLKSIIREAAEKEEYTNYHGRMGEEWLKDLEKLETDWKKPFLEDAPWLIIVFKKVHDLVNGEKKKNYYVNESVGIASGFLISAIHNAGLVTLTHTPSPMNFLEKILNRPSNERAFLLLPVGYPEQDVKVPELTRKKLSEVSKFYK